MNSVLYKYLLFKTNINLKLDFIEFMPLTGKIQICESEIIDNIASKYQQQKVLLRVTPNIDPYPHEKTTTGLKDSKFGLNMDDGSAEKAIELISSKKNIFFAGIHAHLGSPINFI